MKSALQTIAIVTSLHALPILPVAFAESCSVCLDTCASRGATLRYCEILCRSACDGKSATEIQAILRTYARHAMAVRGRFASPSPSEE